PVSQLTWFDRHGKPLGSLGPAAPYQDVALSRDGKRAAATRMLSTAGTDIWLVDVTSGVPSQFTFDPVQDLAPVWSPDDGTLVFASDRGSARNTFGIYRKESRGGSEELLLKPRPYQLVTDWSADGKLLLVQNVDSKSGLPDLFISSSSGEQNN